MPAKSKSQQHLFGMLHAYNKGELKGSRRLMKRMDDLSKRISDEDARHFAETPHRGLPEKKAYILHAVEGIADGTCMSKLAYGRLEAGVDRNFKSSRPVERSSTLRPGPIVKTFKSSKGSNAPQSSLGFFRKRTDIPVRKPAPAPVPVRKPTPAPVPVRKPTPAPVPVMKPAAPAQPVKSLNPPRKQVTAPAPVRRPVAPPVAPTETRRPLTMTNPYEAAARFTDVITRAIKKEHGGTAGVDYNPEGLQTNPVYLDTNDLPGNLTGQHRSGKNPDKSTIKVRTTLPPDQKFSTAVHEFGHHMSKPSTRTAVMKNSFPQAPGISKTDADKLTKAYRLAAEDMPNYTPERVRKDRMDVSEAHTSNREFQARVWRQLSERLGREATYDEFKNYIKAMRPEDIRKILSSPPNGYIQKMLKRITPGKMDIEAVRRAWLEVARNGGAVPDYSSIA